MLIDVLTQQRHCRNVTLRKSYNRAVAETGSGTYAPICLNVQPKPSPGRMAAPNSLRPGLSFRGVHEQGEFKLTTYTKGDGILHFTGGNGYLGEDVHVRQTVKYTDYKQFGTTSTIIYNGQEVEKTPDEKKPDGGKPK